MKSDIPFGVGCFHFWPKMDVPFSTTIDEYAEQLRETLEAIPTISNIQIDFEPDPSPVEVKTKLLNLSDGEDFFPHPVIFEMSFDLYIPYRIQDEITGDAMSHRTLTEHFAVNTRYAFEAPVTFIELKSPSGTAEPSQAVRVVREYLDLEINSGNGSVRFDVLGPSPFHADFYLCPREGKDFVGFELVQNRTRAYDEIEFFYNESEFEIAEIALDDLFSELRDELGFYYYLVLLRAKSSREWDEVTKVLSKLTDTQERRSAKQRMLGILFKGRYINELFTALVTLESEQIFRRNLIDEGYRGIYAKHEPTYLQFYVDEASKELTPYPTKQVSDLAEFLENRRSKTVELFIVLMSALIGGITGALVTILVAK